MSNKNVLGRGVEVDFETFKNLSCEEEGIKVLEEWHTHRYKLYKVVDNTTFYIYSNSKILF